MTVDITTLRIDDVVTTTHGDTGSVQEVEGFSFGPGCADAYTVRVLTSAGAVCLECWPDGAPIGHGTAGIQAVNKRAITSSVALSTAKPGHSPETVTAPLGHLMRLLCECNRLIGRHSWDKTGTMSALVEAVDALTAEIRR